MPRIIAALLLFLFASSHLCAEDAESSSNTIQPEALVLWQREIAVFRAPIATLSPIVRRDTAQTRIEALTKFALYDSVKSQPVDASGTWNDRSFASPA